jgi:hypothetical protein
VSEIERTTISKVAKRLLPFIFLLYCAFRSILITDSGGS